MLDINLSLMVVMLLVFFVMLYQLNKVLYKPLLKFMDDRDAAIAKDLDIAKNMSGNTDALQAEAQNHINEAKLAAAKLRQKVMEEAKSKSAEAIAKKQDELEKMQAEAAKKLKEERVALENALLSQIPLVKESLKAKFSQL